MAMAFPGVCDVCQQQSGCQMAVVISTMRLDESIGLIGYNKSSAYILYNYYYQITTACPHLLIPLVIHFRFTVLAVYSIVCVSNVFPCSPKQFTHLPMN